MTTAVCTLPKLPRNPAVGAEVCDKYGNRWRFNAESGWVSLGAIQVPVEVTETSDGVITPEIFGQLSKLGNFVASGADYRPLKILPGRDAYWYYLRSSDKFVKFTPEGEDALRVEVDKGRLFQVLHKSSCPGPRGDRGDAGAVGKSGKPGPAEICYTPVVEGNRLDFSIYTPTPLLVSTQEIPLPNGHIPEISVRVFEVSLPINATVAKVDPLQHLAVYYHGVKAEAVKFQKTREKLVLQNITGSEQPVCAIAMSQVQMLPLGSVVDVVPLVTVEVDPFGLAKPIITFNSSYPVDIDLTTESLNFDLTTNIICGSIYLKNTDWPETLCVKSRQKGPDGEQGQAGEPGVRVINAVLDSTSVVATCPIITARVDVENQSIFTICADIANLVCVQSLGLAPNAAALSDRTAMVSSFASAQMILDDCKLINQYAITLVDDNLDDLQLIHWEPQEGCVTKRHFNRHNFKWIPSTDIPACDAAVQWYGPDMNPKPAKYPWFINAEKPPETESCCREDFFYCPNIQDSGCSH